MRHGRKGTACPTWLGLSRDIRIFELDFPKAYDGTIRPRLHNNPVQLRDWDNQPVPFNLDIKEGERTLASWHPGRERVWQKIAVGPVDWRAGEPLVLAARGPHPPGQLNGAILDFVEMEWAPHSPSPSLPEGERGERP